MLRCRLLQSKFLFGCSRISKPGKSEGKASFQIFTAHRKGYLEVSAIRKQYIVHVVRRASDFIALAMGLYLSCKIAGGAIAIAICLNIDLQRCQDIREIRDFLKSKSRFASTSTLRNTQTSTSNGNQRISAAQHTIAIEEKNKVYRMTHQVK